MLLKAIIKPFTWIYLGFTIVLKSIFEFVTSFVKYVAIGIVTVFKGLGRLLQLFGKYLLSFFEILGDVLIKLGKLLGRGFKYVGIGITKTLKYLFIFIKKLFHYVFLGVAEVINWCVSFITYVGKGIVTVFKYIGLGIYHAGRYEVLGFVAVFGGIFKLIALIPKGIAELFKALGNFFVAFYEKILKAPVVLIADKFSLFRANFVSGAKELPKKIKNGVVNWANNLQFIKHSRNKREMKRQALLIDFNSKEAERSEKKLTYQYTAKNPEGKTIKGVFAAYSKVDVHSFLISEGYEVYDIKTSSTIEFLYGGSVTKQKLKPKQLIFFLTQLSTYIKAGIPLTDSIRILAKQDKRASIRRMFQGIIYELTMGESFSEALNKQGNVFPKLLINMIKTSEMTGELPEALDDMANYYTAVEKSRKQTISALAYPSVIFVLAIIVLAFILIWVVPQFVTIYGQAGADIPDITKFTIALSAFLQQYIWLLIIGIITLVVLFIVMYRNIKFFRTIVQWLLMHIPVIGKIMIYNEITTFAKTFGSLLRHNVFITDSMEILSKITDNEVYKMLIFDTISNLARGESISVSFKDHWAVPIIAYEMMVTGERTGQLPTMMEKVADYFQEEQKNMSAQLKAFLEPAVIVFLAITVGLILMSVVIPMFNLYGNISSGA